MKYKFIIILQSFLIIILLCLFFSKKKQSNIQEETTSLFQYLNQSLTEEISQRYKNYLVGSWMKEEIDSFMCYANEKPYFNSDNFNSFLQKSAMGDTDIPKYFLKLHKKINNTKDFLWYKELLTYVYLNNLVMGKTENLCVFDGGISAQVYSQKDTINMGETYMAEIDYVGTVLYYIPTMIVDGDTIPVQRANYIFSETPKKAGMVQHTGTISFDWQGHPMELPFTIEYYVK